MLHDLKPATMSVFDIKTCACVFCISSVAPIEVYIIDTLKWKLTLKCLKCRSVCSKHFMFMLRLSENLVQRLLYTSLGAAVVADVLIASSLCVLLRQRRTGFQRFAI